MAHVCYKANSSVCHTTPILDVAHDNVQQPAHNLLAVYKLAVHRAILLPDITSHQITDATARDVIATPRDTKTQHSSTSTTVSAVSSCYILLQLAIIIKFIVLQANFYAKTMRTSALYY